MKQLLVALAAAISLAASAHAQLTLHITGSTAFRASATAAAESYLGTGYKGAYVASGANGQTGGEGSATYCVLQNNAGTTTIYLTWTGSIGGIITVASQVSINAVPTNGWLQTSNITSSNSVTSVATGTYDSGIAPDACFSDCPQSSSSYTSPVLTPLGTQGGKVAVIPFDVVFGNGNTAENVRSTYPTIANIAGISTLNFQVLLGGVLPLSALTGNTNDSNTAVYAIGRNFDSGTRLSTIVECGLATAGNYGPTISIQQAGLMAGGTTLTNSGGSSLGVIGSTITDIGLFPPDTLYSAISGISNSYKFYAAGESGYASGSTCGKLLATPGAIVAPQDSANPPFGGAPGYIISYLGRSDSNTAIGTSVDPANSAFKIAFDGGLDDSTSTSAGTTIPNGKCHTWEYEWMYAKPSGLSGAQTTALGTIAGNVINDAGGQTTAAGITLGAMNVARSVAGAPPE